MARIYRQDDFKHPVVTFKVEYILYIWYDVFIRYIRVRIYIYIHMLYIYIHMIFTGLPKPWLTVGNSIYSSWHTAPRFWPLGNFREVSSPGPKVMMGMGNFPKLPGPVSASQSFGIWNIMGKSWNIIMLEMISGILWPKILISDR